jgi:transcriptional regulator with XRE-family HTH domain|tara:strand:- start:3726 stop:4295 length:570 start_codon:yes stop_codon:yes gene_type:complete
MSSKNEQTEPILCQRVAKLRKQHGLTLDQLANTSGVSRSMLSQIERGQANPTLTVTFRIAQAFGITIGKLVDQPWEAPSIEVLHGGDANNLFRSDDKCTIRTLSPLQLERSVEFYEIALAPGESLQSAAHFEGTRELLTVTKGEAEVESGETCRHLHENDTASYRADLNHCIRNVGKERLVCYLVVTSQ